MEHLYLVDLRQVDQLQKPYQQVVLVLHHLEYCDPQADNVIEEFDAEEVEPLHPDHLVLEEQLLLDLGVANQFAQLVVEVEVDVGSKDDHDHNVDGGVDPLNGDQFPVEGNLDGEKGEEDKEYNFHQEVEDEVHHLHPLYLEVGQQHSLQPAHPLLLCHHCLLSIIRSPAHPL